MAVSKTWNNTSYSIPQSGNKGWASLTDFLTGLADNAQTIHAQSVEATSVTTTPYSVLATDCFLAVNIASASSILLPAGTDGRVFYIADASGAASSNNITVTPNGGNTILGTSTYVINGDNQAIGLIFNNGDWSLIANFSTIAITESSTNTFSNKSLIDASTYIVDDGDNTKKVQLQVSGVTTGTTRTITIPDADFTPVGTTLTQTLTNKSLSDSTTAIVDDGDATKKIAFQASGITTATTRTITMPDADVNLGSLTNSNLSASAAIAVTKVAPGTANQLIGANSGATANEYKSIAVGTAGTDFAVAHTANTITLDLPSASTANRGVVTTSQQSIGGLKKFEGGGVVVGTIAANDSNVTFTDADKRIQICTPTAARTYTLPTTSIKAGEVWEFFNQATTSTYVITVQSSGANTIDYVMPAGYLKLIALQDTPTTAAHWKVLTANSSWLSYTPAFTGFGTVSSVGAYYKRQGDNLHVRTNWTTGTVAGSLASISLPSSMTIDTNKSPIANTTSAGGPLVGQYGAAGATSAGHLVTATGTSTALVYFGYIYYVGSGYLTPQNGSSIIASSSACGGSFIVPISGWNG